MDRVIAYNIVLAHIAGRANAAADFLSRMQTDPKQSLELQLLDSIPLKHIEIDKKANAGCLDVDDRSTKTNHTR